MQEQLSRPLGHVVPECGLRIFGDVGADEPDLAFFDAGISLVERKLAVAEAFDFAAGELHAAFERVENLESKASLAIFGNEADLLFRFARYFFISLGHGEVLEGQRGGGERGKQTEVRSQRSLCGGKEVRWSAKRNFPHSLRWAAYLASLGLEGNGRGDTFSPPRRLRSPCPAIEMLSR